MVCSSDNKRNEGSYMARKQITREILLCAILDVVWPASAWRTSVNAGRTVPGQSGMPSQPVPALTRIRDINLNNRVSLRSKANSVAF